MAWKTKFSRRSLKFLESLDNHRQSGIKERLNELLAYLDKGIFPYGHLDIKKLGGKWKGRYRMREGNVRIIVSIDMEDRVVSVYQVNFGSVLINMTYLKH